ERAGGAVGAGNAGAGHAQAGLRRGRRAVGRDRDGVNGAVEEVGHVEGVGAIGVDVADAALADLGEDRGVGRQQRRVGDPTGGVVGYCGLPDVDADVVQVEPVRRGVGGGIHAEDGVGPAGVDEPDVALDVRGQVDVLVD